MLIRCIHTITAIIGFRNKPGDEYIRYYIRLAFHSHYPWEAFDGQGAEAMQYSLSYDGAKEALVPNIIMYGGVNDGVD